MRADLGLIQNLLLGVRITILLLIVGLGVFGVFSSQGNYTTGIFAMAPITIIPIMIFLFGDLSTSRGNAFWVELWFFGYVSFRGKHF